MTAELAPLRVDLNADLGEGAPHDAALLALVSSINVACGWHASDARLMQHTVVMAMKHGVAIGAHPSFFDRENFGRTEMQVALADVRADMLYQIGALDAMVRAAGGRMQHVKPHGAIYNQAARDPALAETIVAAVRDFDPSLIIYGLAGGELLKAAERAGLRAVSEVFSDRGYRADGSLVPRTEPGAYIESPEDAAARVLRAVREGVVEAVSGELLPLRAQSICLHGDGPRALPFARAIHAALREAGIAMRL